MNFTLVETMLVLLLTTLTVTVVFRAIRLPVILGWLVVGAIVGPHVLSWLPDTQDIKELAEFGVALLLFTIGLDFSLSRLIALRRTVFILGGLQVMFSIAITLGLGLLLNMSLIEALVIACVISMSSTAIVIKQLNEQFEVQSEHGLNAVGILLFQDLAVIPILVLIASLAGTQQAHFAEIAFWSLAKGIVAILLIISIGRWLLKPLFHLIASTRVIELFTLSVLFVALGAAWLTNSMGMSYALGAFLAGIMLGETEFRHQIKIEIRPFRDVLLGLFFVSIGMLVNIKIWIDTAIWIALLLMAIILGKTLLITILCKLSRYNWGSAARTGIILSQGGEFGFAILTVALNYQLLPADYGQVVLAALLITFALAPIIIRYNKKIAAVIFPQVIKQSHEKTTADIQALSVQLSQHIIICGYGRVGQHIAHLLDKLNYAYIGLDLDPDIIAKAQLAGDRVAYGNATHLDILATAQLDKASAILISFNNVPAAVTITEQIRHIKPHIPILVRCKDETEFDDLRQSGATKIVTEVFEESLSLASHLLQLIDIPKEKIAHLLAETRDKNYALLYQVFPGSFTEALSTTGSLHEHLRPIMLSGKARSLEKPLESVPLQHVEVIAIRRGSRHLKPKKDTILKAGDILILYGLPSDLAAAEDILL